MADDFGLRQVYADVVGSDASYQMVVLTLESGVTYKGTATLPPNLTPDPIGYQVTVWAQDINDALVGDPAGEATVDGTAPLDEAPIVGDTSVTPASLPFGGGLVTIQANAEDHRSVSEVFATVALPGGGSAQVPMENVGSNRYQGTFPVPANARTTSVEYGFSVTAIDDIGQPTTEPAGKVTVAGRPAPSLGRLKVSPDKVSFGDIRIGAAKQRAITIKNNGRKQDGPIAFVLETTGAFVVVGPDHVTLAPGKKVDVIVAFRPTAAGDQKGTLAIERGDGGQPGLAVALKGKGKRR